MKPAMAAQSMNSVILYVWDLTWRHLFNHVGHWLIILLIICKSYPLFDAMSIKLRNGIIRDIYSNRKFVLMREHKT